MEPNVPATKGIKNWWPDRQNPAGSSLKLRKPTHSSEKQVETYLVRGFKDRGGLCLKWVSPGRSGVPDRIGFLPQGRFFLIEVKTKVGKCSKIQQLVHTLLAKLGFTVHVVYGKNGVDKFFEEIVDE